MFLAHLVFENGTFGFCEYTLVTVSKTIIHSVNNKIKQHEKDNLYTSFDILYFLCIV